MTFAEKVIGFNEQLEFTGNLPSRVRIMNPLKESDKTIKIVQSFYGKYFNDNNTRHIILGINPGRFGGGITGIPFTDPKRLMNECKIDYNGRVTHEPSSVFVYEVIKAWGGVSAFYKKFYINSPCPLGFTLINTKGKEKNYNYYDSKELINSVRSFMIECIGKLIRIGINTDVCFVFGIGKNQKFLNRLNEEYNFFKKIIYLEHPRYIMQYKKAESDFYIKKYISAFKTVE